MSPTVFRFKRYRFFFFSREESRMHVHVHSPDGEAKFWLSPSVSLAYNWGLSKKEVAQLVRVVEEHRDEIVAAWKKHFKA